MRTALAALLLALAHPGVARAQADAASSAETTDPGAEAKQHYADGEAAYAARRFAEAAMHFEAAASRRPHPAALYNAALAWEQANRPDRAADDYGRALDVAGLSAALAQAARARIGTLQRTLGTVQVTAPEGVRVQLDEGTETAAPARLHGTAGVHALTLTSPGGTAIRRDVTLEAGKTTSVALTPSDVAPKPEPPPPPPPPPKVEAPPPPVPPPSPPEWWTLRRAIGVGVVGVGVATLAGSIVLGTSALDARDAYNAAPSQAGYDHASSLQTWTNVTLIGGAVVVAGGAALILWPSPKAHEPGVALVPTLGGAAAVGAF